jgi:hydrogenase nickel incorporation protein HypA/HybF
MSIVESLVELVAEQAQSRGFARVRVIRLQVGVLGHAQPAALRFCFDAVARGTVAQGARLEIELINGAGWCPACCRRVNLEELYSVCPVCGEAGVQMTAGSELDLTELEVE